MRSRRRAGQRRDKWLWTYTITRGGLAPDSWVSMFQHPKYRGFHLLDLKGKGVPLQPMYLKNGGPWLASFGESLSMMTRATRCVTGHAPSGEYRRRFFPGEPFWCLDCPTGPVQTRGHILNHCKRYTRVDGVYYPMDSVELVDFLRTNESAFSFADAPLDPSGEG